MTGQAALIHALEGLQPHPQPGNGNGGHRARCPLPGHKRGDQRLSLSWWQDAQGDVHVTCHADHGHTSDDILRALGFEWQDRRAERPGRTYRERISPIPRGVPDPEARAAPDPGPSGPVVVYPCRDTKRRTWQHHRRGDGKGKRVWWRDADGGDETGEMDRDDCLYLPKPIPEDADRVYWTEGEKAADALSAAGFWVVGLPGGASSTPTEGLLRLVVAYAPRAVQAAWPDAVGGIGYMTRVVAGMRAIGVEPDWVTPADDWSDGWDAADVAWPGLTAHGLHLLATEPTTTGDRDEAKARVLTALEGRVGHAAAAEPTPGKRRLTITMASDTDPRPVKWMWADRLPVGCIYMLGGREGIGKSQFWVWLVALITTGGLPGEFFGTPRNVVVVATEDSWEHVIVPRLMAVGADLAKVGFVRAVAAEGFDSELMLPQDNDELERLIVEMDAVLAILDPLLSRLDARLDTHKDADVRRAMEPLARMAERTRCGFLCLIHVNKGADNDPLQRLMASRAFPAVARSVLFMANDPDDEDHRLVGLSKNQYGPLGMAQRCHIEGGMKVADSPDGPVMTSRLVWDEMTNTSIREAVEVEREVTGSTAEAAVWLEDYLGGSEVKKQVVTTEGKKAGHGVTALDRAAKRLRVAIRFEGFPRESYWSLPQPDGGPGAGQRPGAGPSHVTYGESEMNDMTDMTGGQSPQSRQLRQSSQTPREADMTGSREDPDEVYRELMRKAGLADGD